MPDTNTNPDGDIMQEYLIKFFCIHCGQPISTKTSTAGVETECPTCHKAIKIPDRPHASNNQSQPTDESSNGDGTVKSSSEPTFDFKKQAPAIYSFFKWAQASTVGKIALGVLIFVTTLGAFITFSGLLENSSTRADQRDGARPDLHETRRSQPVASPQVQLHRTDPSPCGRCRGRGSMIGQCYRCYGRGTVINSRSSIQVLCPPCQGTGQVPTPCARCKGSGRSAY